MKFLSPLISENSRFIYMSPEQPDYYIQPEDVENTLEKQTLKLGEVGNEPEYPMLSNEEIRDKAITRAERLNKIFEGDSVKDLTDSEKKVVAEKIHSFLDKSTDYDSEVNPLNRKFEGLDNDEFTDLENELDMEIATTLISLGKHGAQLLKALHNVVIKLQKNKDKIDWTDNNKFKGKRTGNGTYSEVNAYSGSYGAVGMSIIENTEISGIQIDNKGWNGDTQLFSKEDLDSIGVPYESREEFILLLRKTLDNNFKTIQYCAQHGTNFDLEAKQKKQDLTEKSANEKTNSGANADGPVVTGDVVVASDNKASATESLSADREAKRNNDNESFLSNAATDKNIETAGITLSSDEKATKVGKVKAIQAFLLKNGKGIGFKKGVALSSPDGWAGSFTINSFNSLISKKENPISTPPKVETKKSTTAPVTTTETLVSDKTQTPVEGTPKGKDTTQTATAKPIERVETAEEALTKKISALAIKVEENTELYGNKIALRAFLNNEDGLNQKDIRDILEQADSRHKERIIAVAVIIEADDTLFGKNQNTKKEIKKTKYGLNKEDFSKVIEQAEIIRKQKESKTVFSNLNKISDEYLGDKANLKHHIGEIFKNGNELVAINEGKDKDYIKAAEKAREGAQNLIKKLNLYGIDSNDFTIKSKQEVKDDKGHFICRYALSFGEVDYKASKTSPVIKQQKNTPTIITKPEESKVTTNTPSLVYERDNAKVSSSEKITLSKVAPDGNLGDTPPLVYEEDNDIIEVDNDSDTINENPNIFTYSPEIDTEKVIASDRLFRYSSFDASSGAERVRADLARWDVAKKIESGKNENQFKVNGVNVKWSKNGENVVFENLDRPSAKKISIPISLVKHPFHPAKKAS